MLRTSDGSSVSWQDPPTGNGSGDISAVNAGAGLTGGGSSGRITLELDSTASVTVAEAFGLVTGQG